MTFSIVARCPATGMLGCAVTTSSISVGSRCSHARAGLGAALTQHRTDPRLGPQALDLLTGGMDPGTALEIVARSAPGIDYRQLALIDKEGRTACFHGAAIASTHGHATTEGALALGNILRSGEVPQAMIEGFMTRPGEPLAERLLMALEAGEKAGGEWRQLKSAALLVVHETSFPLVDLREDFDAQPLVKLRLLWELYRPQIDLYVDRALRPESVPGVA